MIAPDRREITLMILGLVWFFVMGPPILILAIYFGLPPATRSWIALIHFLIFALLGGAGVFLYTRRVAREMGAPGLAATAIWILLAFLLARALMSALRSIGQ